MQHVFYPYCNVKNQVTVDAVHHPNIPVVKNQATRVQSNCTTVSAPGLHRLQCKKPGNMAYLILFTMRGQ